MIFILVNSILGFLGHISSARLVPSQAVPLGAIALMGGLIGSWFGVHRPEPLTLREGPEIPLRMAPMVLIGTVLTHVFGGSAGREGTAVQMGGMRLSRPTALRDLTATSESEQPTDNVQ